MLQLFQRLLMQAQLHAIFEIAAKHADAVRKAEQIHIPVCTAVMAIHQTRLGRGNGLIQQGTLGLLGDTPQALAPLRDRTARALFAKYGVLTESEMESRYEIGIDDYKRRILIEGEVALDIARSMIRPVVADEFSKLATAIGQAKKDGLKVGLRGLTALSLKLGAGLDDLHVKCERVEKTLAKGEPTAILGAMDDLRRTVDRLEHLVDDSRWPLPKYREMLFVY